MMTIFGLLGLCASDITKDKAKIMDSSGINFIITISGDISVTETAKANNTTRQERTGILKHDIAYLYERMFNPSG